MSKKHDPRKGLKDIWNSFMTTGAYYSLNDIPFCPTTSKTVPKSIITWSEAKGLVSKYPEPNFFYPAFVCFFEDDCQFDGPREGIWFNSKKALKILKHFEGVISPDFSTYQDFPYPLKIYNTYRTRAFGYWLGKQGIQVINSVRWGTEESFAYCFDGLPDHSWLAIGTVGGSPRRLDDRERFNKGFFKMIEQLSPTKLIVYGSANYPCFKAAEESGIEVLPFTSRTCAYFQGKLNV